MVTMVTNDLIEDLNEAEECYDGLMRALVR